MEAVQREVNRIHIAVCDDEAGQRDYLISLIGQWFAGHSALKGDIRQYPSAEAFLFDYEENKDWQLLVLDIEMKEISGMKLAKKIRAGGDSVPIVFVTGYDEYLEEGYDVEALHYLMKPLSEEKFNRVLDRALLRQTEPRHVFETEEGSVSLALSSIWYAEADGHYCALYTQDKSYKLRCSISALEKRLQGTCFEKAHRSFLVNLTHVLSITHREVIMDDGRRIPLSRNVYKEFNLAFINMYEDNN